jgi:hypothetical protein
VQACGLYGWPHDRLLCASSKIRQGMGEVMFLLLENFVKGRKKYKNPKSEHTGFVPSKEPKKETHKCTDHEGNIYKSYIEMCKYYEINYKTFLSRKTF